MTLSTTPEISSKQSMPILNKNTDPTTPETPASCHPLSLGQQALWFLYQMAPESVAYNVCNTALICQTIDIDSLNRAWQKVVHRHPILRTTYTAYKGKPFQIINEQLECYLQVRDASNWSEEYLKEQISLEIDRTFNLEEEPVARLNLFTRSAQKHILLLTGHHIAGDLWSSDQIFNELRLWYTAETEQVSLEQIENSLPKNTPYTQFVHWQSEMLSSPKGEKLWKYWQKQLSGELPIVNLPTDRPRPPMQSFRGETHIFRLNEELIRGLGDVARATGTTIYKLMLAAYFALLYRYTNQADILVGTPMLGRPGREFKGVVGYFVNSVVLRASLSGNLTFKDLLAQLSSTVKEAQRHQDYPFPLLVEKLQPQRDPSRSPLFQVSFTWQKQRWCESGKELGFKMEPYPLGHQPGASFDLDLMVMEIGEIIQVCWQYNTDLFDGATIARMAGHFQTLLEGIVANPDRKLSELPLLTATETHQLLVEWNNRNLVQIESSFAALTASPSLKGRGGEKRKNYASSQLGFALKSQKCVHQLFEVQVELTPDAVAVVFEDQQLTYRELNAKANQLAHYLQKLGVKPEVLVGICVERSLEMAVGLLGILKAGGAYVPLDPAFPKQRLAAMVEDSQVSVLVTSSHLVDGLLTRQTDAVCLDTDWETIARESQENPVSFVRAQHLVYVIYTSGSIGTPKGVAIEHRQLLNYLHSIQQILDVPNASFATVSTFAADLGNTAIFPALCGGGCLHIISQDRATDPKALAEYFRQHAIDCLKIVPSHLKALLAQTASILPRKRLILGGEALSWELVEKVWKYAPDCLIFNHYGPTETTVGVLTYQVKRGQVRRNSQTVPLGRPISNTEIYILDSHFQPMPVGTAGELYIGGAALGRGYLNQLELTAEKFIANPFAGAPGEARLYKTGDRARYLPDGNIEFLGRTDNQVKIRGFRIELGEIESLLAQHPDVGAAVIIAREDTPGDKRLVAYVVPKQEPAPTWSELRRFLFEQVPEYMVPAAFVILEALPLTANGKVDRRSLPAPDTCHLSLETSFVSPRSHLEMQLVQIWEDVLNVYPVGVQDCFFERGGHSLLAVRLMALIQQQFGKSLPLASLFQNSTIEHQANLVLQQTDSVPFSPLVAIQTAGSQPPFFCVHPVGGNVLCYFELARHLGKEQPFYGLQSAGLNGEQEPKTSIEDMAAHYIEALQAIQPSGPYYLGGWSLGGIVAFEMAQQLRDRGEEVALLTLIDSYAPTVIDWHEDNDETSLLVHLARDMGGLFGKELPLSADELQQFPPEEQLNYILERSKNLNILPPEVSLEQMRHLMRVFQANREAMLSYIPQPYPGKIALLSASEKPLQVKLDPTQGWGELATHGLLDIQPIPGDHYAILRAPHVQLLAQQLATYLKSGNQ